VLRDRVAAVSVGIVDGHTALDLDYKEDLAADVDMNVVMTGGGAFVEVQGAGEEATFDEAQLHAMLALAKTGIARIVQLQHETIS
jgi:ribonuclease PH